MDRSPMDDRQRASLLRYAEELEARDQALAASLDELEELTDEVVGLRARAVAVTATLEQLPFEIEVAVKDRQAAEAAVGEATGKLTEAEERATRLEASRRSRQDEVDQAQRDLTRARDNVHDATARVARSLARAAQLRDDQAALQAEGQGLVVTARSLVLRLQKAPRVADAGKTEPGATVAELDEWGARARAALFVSNSTFVSERERVLLEANALGVSVFGEETGAVSVALIRRRLEVDA
jgi:chromosome segregation ATPase